MHKNQKGFSHVELVLILVIVGIISFVGYRVHTAVNGTNNSLSNAVTSSNSGSTTKKTPPVTTTETPASDPNSTPTTKKLIPPASTSTDGTSTLTISDLGLSFKAPVGWILTEEATTNSYDDSTSKSWTISNPGEDYVIGAGSSSFPIDGHVCDTDGELSSVKIALSRATVTAAFRIVGIEDEGYYVAVVPSEGSPYQAQKKLGAPTVAYSNLTVGNTYYYCSPATLPVSWFDYDKDRSTHNSVSIGKTSDGKPVQLKPGTIVPDYILNILSTLEWNK